MNNFILLVGKSGSGKTALCKELYEKYGLTSVQSYTSRPQREPNEYGHIFVDDCFFEEHYELDDMVGYTNFNGYEYCALQEQVEENDIYVIDLNGIDYFVEHYEGNKEVKIIYLDVPEDVLYERLVKRDGEAKAKERVDHDKVAFQNAELYADFTLTETNLKKLTTQVRHIWKYGTTRNRTTNLHVLRKE